jgi:hypothetical protein
VDTLKTIDVSERLAAFYFRDEVYILLKSSQIVEVLKDLAPSIDADVSGKEGDSSLGSVCPLDTVMC